jgi:hypothetical protein
MKIVSDTNLKVAIRRRPESFLSEIYLYSRRGNDTVFLTISSPSTVTEHIVTEAGQAIPAFVIPENLVRDLIQGFMSEGQDLGIKLPDESFAQGKLEAQSHHLQDLRKILNIDKPSNGKDH